MSLDQQHLDPPLQPPVTRKFNVKI